jgi:putative ATP-dependent endonuclease of the OLD family
MKISQLKINNFRGIKNATILLPDHAVLIGDNNTGKTTILEAIDLVLGPDRLNRTPPIDEHDFHLGNYLIPEPPADVAADVAAPQQASYKIEIEATVTSLNEEQQARFGDYIEFWDKAKNRLYNDPNPAGVDAEHISEALRVTFHGWYDPEEDDFEGRTFYSRSLLEGESPSPFSKKDKQTCGFLYLRSIRTGSRALSLERGSLLDIILRLKEVRPKMWEDTINTLAAYNVASDPELGISGVLESINSALKKYVPKEWGIEPHLKVSNLTRDHLRKVITAFIATGEGNHAAPFYRQGTGTINMLVLAMLSQIAEDKQNVIFAMEEPETAIPPYAQKRIVHEIRKLASQTIFTSHSPYVLEEFTQEETVVLSRNGEGSLNQSSISLPDSIKKKRYRQEFRTRFCEGLLSRRILLAEGASEAQSLPAVCRRLSELNPGHYSSLEALGICTIDAGTESQIADLGRLYSQLGKRVFAICDKQTDEKKALIVAEVDTLFMHEEKGFENLVLRNVPDEAITRFANTLEWPQHIQEKYPNIQENLRGAIFEYFTWSKAGWSIADFLSQCTEDEIPNWLKGVCSSLKDACEPPAVEAVE